MNKNFKRLIIIFIVFCIGGIIYNIAFGPLHLGSVVYGILITSMIDVIDNYLGLKN